MTKPIALVVPPNASGHRRALPLRWLLAGSALALAACTSVPLPEWPHRGSGATTTSRAPAPAPAMASLFPEPGQRYNTPGLSGGRNQFTTNAELTRLLRQLPQHTDGGQQLAVLEAGSSQNGQPIYAVLAAQGGDL